MFNEVSIAHTNIEAVIRYTSKIRDTFTVVAVDDGSTDNTGAVLQDLLSVYPSEQFRVLTHRVNMGYGTALRTGIVFAINNSFDYVLFMDSDLTNHPKYINGFYDRMLEKYDYIKASRYGLGAGVSGVPFFRKLVSLLGNKIAQLLFGLPLRDLTNGFRAVKTSILSQITLRENGFAVIMEELFLCKGLVYSYAEVPYILTARLSGQGKSHFSYDLKTYFTYLKYSIKSIGRRRPNALDKK
jgi:dolichol-phosphate mannosyltransferase